MSYSPREAAGKGSEDSVVNLTLVNWHTAVGKGRRGTYDTFFYGYSVGQKA
jgi:hypothetical protein